MRYVALPSAKPDKSSYGERALIEKGLPYLRLRWKSDDWRVYEVLLPAPLVISQGDANIVLEQFSRTRCCSTSSGPVRRSSRCAGRRTGSRRTPVSSPTGTGRRVIADEVGFVRLSTRFSPERLFQRGRRCDDDVTG